MIPQIFTKFIDEFNRVTIRDWILDCFKQGLLFPNPVSPHRYFRDSALLPHVPPAFTALVQQASQIAGATVREPIYGWIVSVQTEGAAVHGHSDPAPVGQDHVRINVLIQKPYVGGNPIMDGIEYPINEGDAWECIANHMHHATMPVIGPQHRLLCSIGFLRPV